MINIKAFFRILYIYLLHSLVWVLAVIFTVSVIGFKGIVAGLVHLRRNRSSGVTVENENRKLLHFWTDLVHFYLTQVQSLLCLVTTSLLLLNLVQMLDLSKLFVKLLCGFVKVVTWICQPCYMFFSSFAKYNILKLVDRLEKLNKVQRLNALGPLFQLHSCDCQIKDLWRSPFKRTSYSLLHLPRPTSYIGSYHVA